MSKNASLTGRRLGVFEVRGLLGAGGMGEVYRALDTRLDREVAIKILPSAFRNDHQRVVRFEREARVLASLNHPHIGVVHGLEEVDGLKALVMELVQGEDLAERLAFGPLPVGETLDVARQIAAALEAAHDKGIVHRDLKPANIKRRPDGTVKVLDFGLAKPRASDADTTVTVPGTVEGTPAYMSPEQARGEPVDGQADIWSFGVVLFELLTGVSPFARKTTAETLASVLSAAPDYSLLPSDTPPNIGRLIRRCIERDRRRRLHHISDALVDLEDTISTSAVEATGLTEAHAPAAIPKRSQRWVPIAAIALVLGGIFGALWLLWSTAPSPVVRTMILADTFRSGSDRSLAFIPDGSRVGYISSDARQIFVRALDALEPVAILTSSAYVKGLYPSPDGRWFAYIENNFTVKKVSTTGGSPVAVVIMDGPSRGAAWGPDDMIAFATGAPDTGIQLVPAGGGPVTVLTRPDHERGEADHVQPTWLPGGRSLLFTIVPVRGGRDDATVAVFDLETKTTHIVFVGGYAARYVHSGHIVYAASDALWAAPFDLSRRQTAGAPVEVVRPLTVGLAGAAAEFDVADNGTLAYSAAAVSNDRQVPVWVDRKGRETPLTAPPDRYRHPRLAPVGTRLAIGVGDDIYVWELTRPWSAAQQMTIAPGIDWFPVWTPDSRRIVFGSWRGGGFSNLYIHDLETGSAARLTDSPDMQLPTSISRDGATVIFHRFDSVTRSVQALQLTTRAQPRTLVETPVEERNGEISPDGHWLAYEGESPSRPGQLEVYVRPFPDTDRGVWQVTRDGGMFPLWARNGRELFYVTIEGAMVAVPVEASGTTWKTGNPAELFRGRYVQRDGSLGRQYDVASDGRFVMLKREATGESPHIVIVQNWLTDLARRVR